jgi:hypothetical protein
MRAALFLIAALVVGGSLGVTRARAICTRIPGIGPVSSCVSAGYTCYGTFICDQYYCAGIPGHCGTNVGQDCFYNGCADIPFYCGSSSCG